MAAAIRDSHGALPRRMLPAGSGGIHVDAASGTVRRRDRAAGRSSCSPLIASQLQKKKAPEGAFNMLRLVRQAD
ncbi:hypothetical protein [Burkholderia sp. FL-7-2-10-S1-D7]|uniref:hypothetical protein n=1 Tax=Burkholderia sp. FL-7-2-10-S1-D7 TaxID=1637866 RepID=UPI000B03E080|nr:hypothetical protein [Burkholderia sp. FL-7-2-10-S1-D7]